MKYERMMEWNRRNIDENNVKNGENEDTKDTKYNRNEKTRYK